MVKKEEATNEATLLSLAFIRWGLGLFIFGLILGYTPLTHYLGSAIVGSGQLPPENLTLWLGCPTAVQIGALGMMVIGAIYGLFPTGELETEYRDYAALWLCIFGLLAIFLAGYVGYFLLNKFSVFSTQAMRETVWLILLSLSTGVYIIGVALVYFSILDLTTQRSS